MMYRICPDCGSHLDSGEKCDCKAEQEQEARSARGGDEHGDRITAAGGAVPRYGHISA